MAESSASLRVTGAGPTLSYEIVEPVADPSGRSPVTLRCLYGNSSHRGVWRLVARELTELPSVLLDFRGHGDSDHVSPPRITPRITPAIWSTSSVVSFRAHTRSLAHSAGALAAARFIPTSPPEVPMPVCIRVGGSRPVCPPLAGRIFPSRRRFCHPNVPEDRRRESGL